MSAGERHPLPNRSIRRGRRDHPNALGRPRVLSAAWAKRSEEQSGGQQKRRTKAVVRQESPAPSTARALQLVSEAWLREVNTQLRLLPWKPEWHF